MAWVAVASAGLGVGKYLMGRGKKAKYDMPTLNIPDYVPSKYDAPAAGQLFSTLQNRVAGRDVGFAPEDVVTMNQQAIDESAKASNEMINKGMAGRNQTGGVTKGSTNLLREKAILGGGQLRSNALRDVAIKNAVQKRLEVNAAIPQEQTFLTGERKEAHDITDDAYRKAIGVYNAELGNKEEADKVYEFNQSRNQADTEGLFDLLGGFTGGMSGGGSSINDSLYPLGKMIANTNKSSGFKVNSGGKEELSPAMLWELMQGRY
jgi:hypothetical protein